MRSRSEACELCATPTAPSRHTSDSLLRSKTPTARPDPRVPLNQRSSPPRGFADETLPDSLVPRPRGHGSGAALGLTPLRSEGLTRSVQDRALQDS
jgi:hypothetical protein